jgi:hypothetical protein
MFVRLLALAAVIATVAAWPASAAARKVLGFVTRQQPITSETKFVVDAIGRPFPNDPNRCLAVGFAQWPRQKYAYQYRVTVDPPPQAVGVGRQTYNEFDDAPYQPDGYPIRYNARAKTEYVTSIGTFKWAPSLARTVINSLSVGTGCDDARTIGRWSIVKAVAFLSLPVQRMFPDPPRREPDDTPRPPKGAVAMVTEVDGGQLFRNRRGRKQRIRSKDWVKPGDVIWLEGKGAASIEFITGGRTGFVGDRAILILNENQVEDITSEGPLAKPLRRSERIWKMVSERQDPLEVETAGGVFGIKG